jgi:hypothetical protein
VGGRESVHQLGDNVGWFSQTRELLHHLFCLSLAELLLEDPSQIHESAF